MRVVIHASALLMLSLASSAHAGWIRVLPGNVDQVVANAGHVAVRRGSEVWLLREDGSVSWRLAGSFREAGDHERPNSRQEANEILDYFDVAEADRQEDWAHDLVYDERTLEQRRRAHARTLGPSTLLGPRPTLGAGGGNIWIATGHRLLCVGPLGEVTSLRVGQGRSLGLLVAGARVAVGGPDGYQLYSSAGAPETLLPLPTHQGKAAVSASAQRWASATGAEVGWAGPAAVPGRAAFGRPVVDLRYCGETLAILLPDSLVVVAPGGAQELRSRSLVAKHVYCSEDPSTPWLAMGESLLWSVDQGRDWRAIETPTGMTLAAVAVTAHHMWLASDQGLFLSADRAEPRAYPAGTADISSGRRRRGPRRASWLSWLPKVSLRASAVVAPTGQQLEALAYATIPLDPQRLPFATVGFEDLPTSGAVAPTASAAEVVVDRRDPDRHCLATARRKAVELAMAEPERARSYVSRAGHAAWLPEVRMLVSRRYGRSESLDVGTSSTALASPLGIDTVNDIRYEARATWDLARLVFSAEELAAQNQANHMAEVRRDIESTVNRLYHERRRLLLDPAATDAWARRLRGNEIDAELDSLSGGTFGACINDEGGQGRR